MDAQLPKTVYANKLMIMSLLLIVKMSVEESFKKTTTTIKKTLFEQESCLNASSII